MFKNLLVTIGAVLLTASPIFGQRTQFEEIQIPHAFAAAYPAEFQNYKEYDVTFIDERESFFGKKGEAEELKIPFHNYKQVETSKELHVLVNLYHLKGKSDASGSYFEVNLRVIVANQYGTNVFTQNFIGNINAQTAKSKEGAVEVAAKTCLRNCANLIHGFAGEISVRLGYVDKVKKKSEWAGMEDQIEALAREWSKNGNAAFLKAAEPLVPSWEKIIATTTGENIDEVRRAAYQNLVVYYIFSNNVPKAMAINEDYKKIDKEVSAMLGLVKYFASADNIKLVETLNMQPIKKDLKEGGDVVLSKDALLDALSYKLIEGTVTIKDKKKGGTYVGKIKVENKEAHPVASGNMLDLDNNDLKMIIMGTNAAGKADTIYTVISKIEKMTDKAGNQYVAGKLHDPTSLKIAAPTDFGLMMTSFQSPKVSVFRCLLPKTNAKDFVVLKAGDTKGVQLGYLQNFKKVTDYLSGCAELDAKVKSGEVNKNTSVEDIAKIFSTCK